MMAFLSFLIALIIPSLGMGETHLLEKSDPIKASESRITVTAESEPTTFVNSVNVIFGNLLFATTDLEVPGPLPLHLIRYYNSSQEESNWINGQGMTCNYPQWICGLSVPEEKGLSDKYAYALAEFEGGSVVRAAAKFHFDRKHQDYYLDPETIHKGYTNAGGLISARTNLKNTVFHCKGTRDYTHGPIYKAVWSVDLSDGGERTYYTTYDFKDAMNIEQETKPSGNKLRFLYKGKFPYTGLYKRIRATNHSHAHDLGSLDFNLMTHSGGVEVTASNGTRVSYTSIYKKKNPFLKVVESSGHPTIHYNYTKAGGVYRIGRIIKPDGRYLKISYDKQGRVVKQEAPLGPNNACWTLYTFEYHPSDHYTKVLDANQNKRVYHYTSKKRLKRVSHHNSQNVLLRNECFFWGDSDYHKTGEKDRSDEGHLVGKAVEDGAKALTYTKYTYDDEGNITEEKLYGNLSGNSNPTFSLSDTGQVESYSKYYAYSHDRFHLLEKASEDHGPTLEFEYKKGTDLLTAKFTKEGSHIIKREFFDYDSDAVLIEKIVDDGDSKDKKHLSHVTERHITRIKPVSGTTDHGLGEPKEITELYLDQGQERMLRRTTYEYTKEGRVLQETLYDAKNRRRHTISYSYDNQGNLVRKQHSAGKEWIYAYDANKNQIREELLGSGSFIEYAYDAADRLVASTEHHTDLQLQTTYSYDGMSNKRTSVDYMGRILQYWYDGLHRVTMILHPSFTLKTGQVVTPSEHSAYNALSYPTTMTNLNAQTTTYEHTIRGSPCRIVHPDGSYEKMTYRKRGTLLSKTDRRGIETTYKQDIFGRVESETIGGIKTTLHTYSTFHESSRTNPIGLQTRYSYDGAGRLIEEAEGDHKTTYTYDSLSRKRSKRVFGEASEYTETRWYYDAFDRLIQESVLHSSGALLALKRYAYNILDKITEIHTFSSDTDFTTERFEYNSMGLLTKQIDPLGNATTFSYDYGYLNSLQQKVLKKTTIDPLSLKTEEVFDVYDRLALRSQYSPTGQLLSRVSYTYDGVGSKTQEQHDVCVDGAVIRTFTIDWTYTSTNLVASCTTQLGTPEARTTSYVYTRGDLLERILQPNGVTLYHAYDHLGRKIRLTASDGSIDYSYDYDLTDNIISVTDNLHQTVQKRTLDQHGRVTNETFLDALSASYSYDSLDRIVSYRTSLGDEVAYLYASGRLREVIRKDSSGKELYKHIYEEVDLKQRITKSRAIGSVGEIFYSYDALSRLSSMVSPLYNLSLNKFDAVGNLLELSCTDPLGSFTNTYTYDPLYQLTQESGAFNTSFTNDSLSNRLRKGTDSTTIDSLNQLLSEGSTSYTYDLNGNPTQLFQAGQSYVLTYDGLNRLVAIEKPQVSRTEYLYDSWHRRLQKRVFLWTNNLWTLSKVQSFLYFDQREVGSVEEGRLVDFRVLGLGKGAELGASVGLELQGQIYAPIHDHRGNICLLVDSKSNVPAEVCRYSAFGEEAAGTPFSPWRFASKRIDPESGLIFFGRRYYSPAVGRFLTPDPIGFTDGPNLYSYVHNCPMILIDPYGLLTQEEARECAVGGAKGLGEGAVTGFVHPIDTATKYIGHLRSFGSMAYRRDFSPLRETWQNSSAAELTGAATRGVGEIAAAGLVLTPLGRLTVTAGQAMWRGGSALYSSLAPRAVSSIRGLLGREAIGASSAQASAQAAESVGQTVLSQYSKRNFRKGLIEKTGSDPGEFAQAHHIFPQKHAQDFIQKGIDIHNPQHGVWWETTSHQRNAYAYNKEWKEFFVQNPDPSQAQLLEHGASLMTKYENHYNLR